MTGGYDLYPTISAFTLIQHSVKDRETKCSSLFIHSLGTVGQAVKVNMNPQKTTL